MQDLRCRKCGLQRLETDFYKQDGELQKPCKPCRKKLSKVRRDEISNDPVKREKRNAYRLQWNRKNPETRKLYNEKSRKHVRLLALQAYSSEVPSCSCCRENTLQFLAIDHVNGGGNKHRKEIKGAANIYSWLKRKNYPEGFQVLCHNCNLAKGYYGKCPHLLKINK